MARGQAADVGDTRIAKNGYHYTKVESHPRSPNGWILTHWLTAEKELGRHLEQDEMVKFVDPKFKRDPYNPNGIKIIKKNTTSLRKKKAALETRIEELKAELEYVNRQLEET